MIDLRKLKHMIAVDEAGSFSAGAILANVSQSALTRSIAGAEEEIGFKLFHRRAHGATATAEGRDFLDRARRIVFELELLVKDAADLTRKERHTLRVGVCPPAISPFMSRPVSALLAQLPALVLHMTTHSVERALRLLKRGDFDLLVGPTDILTGDQLLHVEPLANFDALPFVRKGHPLAGRGTLAPQDLSQYPMVLPDAPALSSYRSALELVYGNDSPVEEWLSVVEHFPLIATIVAKSDRIGIIGREYHEAQGFLQRFELLDIDLFPTMPVSAARLAINPEKDASRKLARLLAEYWRQP